MWARVKASQVIEIINGAKAMTIDGTQYPASIFRIWSAADLKAKGLYSYTETGQKDTTYYNMGGISYTVDDDKGTVVGTYSSTAKGMDDVKWTSKEISDGDAPDGATTNTVKTEGLKTIWKKKIKDTANSLITPYDWYTLRKAQAGTAIPSDINIHKTISKIMANRKTTVINGKAIDWSTAEALAFGSLLEEGYPVRLVGQDSGRGTFSQRHSVLRNQIDNSRYIPLNNISKKQKKFEIIDSLLSELAVLGFEFGYSLSEPETLVLWEAQFGDFANGAQIIIDQFITSGEAKWGRASGLVMLLPHGYEGQGPEHSSARLERFLQMCAGENIQVVNCTTPANYFHVLRRQMHRDFRKPLIVMTPKSLLRNRRCVSKLVDFSRKNSFHRILNDDSYFSSKSLLKLSKDNNIEKVIGRNKNCIIKIILTRGDNSFGYKIPTNIKHNLYFIRNKKFYYTFNCML